MRRPIIGYHLDEESHWVAELACAHTQHVRHDPPWQVREWTQTSSGRDSHLGTTLECILCDAGAPPTMPSSGSDASHRQTAADDDR